MLPLLLEKKKRSGNVSLKTNITAVNNKVTIDTLIRQFYISVQYFYITNQLIPGDISRVIYKPTKVLKINYFTQTLQGNLSHINKTELMNRYIIKSIKSKWVRL